MTIEFEDITDSLRKVTITGRLDIPGTDEIANRFASLVASSDRRVIVDLTAVNFLASIGIRAIITNAKALQRRGGRMVIFAGQNEAVTKTLDITGIDALIPVFAEFSAAKKAVIA